MLKRTSSVSSLLAVAVAAVAFLSVPAGGATITWDNGGSDMAWSTADNWSGTPDNTEPTIGDDAVFGATGAGTITLRAGEQAQSLTFNDSYTFSGGDLTLGGVGNVAIATGKTVTIGSTLYGGAGLKNVNAGTLALNGANYVTGGIVTIGTVKPNEPAALGNNAISVLTGGALDVLSSGAYYTYIRELSGAGTIHGQYNRGYAINSLLDSTFAGSYPQLGNRGSPFIKTGPGTFTSTIPWLGRTQFGAWQVWRGGVTFGGDSGGLVFDYALAVSLYGGELTLDESTADIDRFPDDVVTTVYSGGASFRYVGAPSANSAETAGTLNMRGRGPALTLAVSPGSGGTATMTFSSYSISTIDSHSSVVGIANFTSTGTLGGDAKVIFTTDPSLHNGVLPGGFVNGRDLATYDVDTDAEGPDTEDGVKAFSAYNNPSDVNTPVATDTVLINAGTTTLALSADRQYNAMKIDGARVLDLNGNNLTVGSKDMETMVVKTGEGEAEIRGLVAGKYLRQWLTGQNNQTKSYAFMVNEGTLKVTAPLQGSGLALRVSNGGPGVLWLDPAQPWASTKAYSLYGSGIFFSDGVIRLDPRDTDFGNETMNLNGGVMEITGGGTYAPTIGTGDANVQWLTSGGFAAKGADATFQPNITWNAASHIPDGAALLLSSTTADSKITLSGTLNLGTDAAKMYLREICVADNTGSENDVAEISGQIISDTTAGGGGTPTDNYHLVKTGPGTLVLSNGLNNYSGATYVKEGTLLVSATGKIAAPASTNAGINPDYAAVTVMNGATLGGSGTVSRKVIVEAGGAISPGASTGIFTVESDVVFQPGAELLVDIAGASSDWLIATSGGKVDLGSNLTLIVDEDAPTGSEYMIVWAAAGITGTLPTVTGDGSWVPEFRSSGTQLWLVPEPGSAALVLLGLVGLAIRRRRRVA